MLDCSNTALGGISCANDSFYYPERSSTYEERPKRRYDGNSTTSSDNNVQWAQDKATFDNLTIDEFNFGRWDYKTLYHEVVGLGPQSFEFRENNTNYANLLTQLKSKWHIGHLYYALWLNAQSTNAGSVLFGAIGGGKFFGDLYRVPDFSGRGDSSGGFSVPVQGVSLINTDRIEQRYAETHEHISILSDTELGNLPDYVLDELFEFLGAKLVSEEYDNNIGTIWEMECKKLLDSNATIGIQISGVGSRIPFNEIGYLWRKVEDIDYCIPGFPAHLISSL